MLIGKRRGWELPGSAATPEAVFRDRRRLCQAIAAGPILLAGASLLPSSAVADVMADPSAALYPLPRNDRYKLDRDLTAEDQVTTFNNY